MFRKILIPLDGSALSEAILPHVRQVAGIFESEATLLRVVPPQPASGPEAYYTDAMVVDEAERYLAELAARLRAQGMRVDTQLRHGPPAQSISEQAAALGAGLIALSTHGRSGFSRWVFGSVTEKLIRLVSIPLLLVRPPVHAPEPEAGRAFSRIVIPLDGSHLAESILPEVEELLRRTGSEVHLVRVEGVEETEAQEKGTFAATRAEIAERYLREAEAQLRAKGVNARGVCRFGRPAEEILRYAEAQRGDLIAMSTHGRSGVSRLLLGSIADKVLRASPIPILLIRGKG